MYLAAGHPGQPLARKVKGGGEEHAGLARSSPEQGCTARLTFEVHSQIMWSVVAAIGTCSDQLGGVVALSHHDSGLDVIALFRRHKSMTVYFDRSRSVHIMHQRLLTNTQRGKTYVVRISHYERKVHQHTAASI